MSEFFFIYFLLAPSCHQTYFRTRPETWLFPPPPRCCPSANADCSSSFPTHGIWWQSTYLCKLVFTICDDLYCFGVGDLQVPPPRSAHRENNPTPAWTHRRTTSAPSSPPPSALVLFLTFPIRLVLFLFLYPLFSACQPLFRDTHRHTHTL